MKYPDGFSERVKDRAFKFKFNKIEALPHSVCGVYVFIHRTKYLYVGKSGGGQGIRERLMAHLISTHNAGLGQWIRALNGTLRVAYIECDQSDLDDMERSLIKHFQPQMNEVRYDSYLPLDQLWEI